MAGPKLINPLFLKYATGLSTLKTRNPTLKRNFDDICRIESYWLLSSFSIWSKSSNRSFQSRNFLYAPPAEDETQTEIKSRNYVQHRRGYWKLSLVWINKSCYMKKLGKYDEFQPSDGESTTKIIGKSGFKTYQESRKKSKEKYLAITFQEYQPLVMSERLMLPIRRKYDQQPSISEVKTFDFSLQKVEQNRFQLAA